MRKFSIALFALLCLCASLLLASCDDDNLCAEGHTVVVDDAVAATCTEDGLSEGSHCSVCEKIITKQTKVRATGHNYSDWKVITEASCTTKGKASKVCQSCQNEQFLDLEMTAHTADSWIIDEDADCINTGSKHKECTKCGTITETETISAFGHTEGEWITDTAAKCTVDGAKHQVCSVCTATIANATIPSTGHTEGAWITDTAAKCTTAGSKHQVCSVCAATIATETIPATGHTPQSAVKENEVAATCTATGSYDEVIYCSVCTDEISRTSKISSKIPHSYKNAKTVTATCSTPGYTVKSCTTCKDTIWSNVSAAAKHTQYGTCPACGINYFSVLCNFLKTNGTQSSNSNGTYYYSTSKDTTTSSIYTLHFQMQYYPSSGKLNIKMTNLRGSTPESYISMDLYNANGSYAWTYYDDSLGYYMTGTLSASSFRTSTTSISYSSTNLSSSSAKQSFNELAVIDLQVMISKWVTFLKLIPQNICLSNFGFTNYGDTHHNFSVSTYTKATCTSSGSVSYQCKNCFLSSKQTIPALGHDLTVETITKEGTCKESGSKLLECTRCNHSKTEVIPALPHENTFVVTDPTCTKRGYTTYTCGKCGHVEVGDYVNALDHNLATHHTYEPATCTATGTERYECSRCDYYEDEDIPMLDHDYKTVSGTTGYVTEKCSGCTKVITTPISYTITYDLAGGTATNLTEYNIETATFSIVNPTREGYTFLGWTGTGLNEKTMQVTIAAGSAENRSYTANWQADTYTVTYDANNGTASKLTDTATYDQQFTLATAERTGYSFVGWYSSDVPLTDGIWKTAENVVLVAKWSPVTYKISYDYAGGSATNQTMYNIESATITLAAPSRTGYTFIGWSGTNLTGLNMNVSVQIGSIGDRSYTANWKANNYTITYDANGGMAAVGSAVVTYNDDYELTTAERVGYDFAGWYDKTDHRWENGTWSTTNHITLIAKWLPRTDTKYVVNHHLQNIDDDNYILDVNSTQNLKGTSDALITPAVNSYVGFTAPTARTVKISADGSLVVDYYYTRNSYTITLITNGGTGCTVKQKYQSILTPNSWSIREGFTFGGWYNDVNLTSLYTLITMPANNATIYAYWAEESKPINFTYSGTSSIAINAYNGTSTTMWIPSHIGGAPVTTISASAFENEAELVKVIIPNTVTNIGLGAFKGCNSIVDITLPFVGKSATATYYEAVFGYIFGYITSKEMALHAGQGDSVTYINSSPSSLYQPANTIWQYTTNSYCMHHYYCYYIPTSIKNVTITSASSISVAAFNNCDFIKTITIPTNITSIDNYAFYKCTGLTSIAIPKSVTSIGDSAFSECTGLTSIAIPESVTSIGNWAFSDCTGLTSITFPASVTSIGGIGAFFRCTGLTTVYYGGTASKWNSMSIESLNDSLTSAARYYYSEEQPANTGKYWHYVDGVPTAW